MRFFLKQFRTYSLTAISAMESNALNKSHLTRHYANNSSHPDMPCDTREKTKKHIKRGCSHTGKENMKPDRGPDNCKNINLSSKEHHRWSKTLGDACPSSRTEVHHRRTKSVEDRDELSMQNGDHLVKQETNQDAETSNDRTGMLAKSSPPQCYIDAIQTLNSLQSNAKTVKYSQSRRDPVETKAVQVDQVLHYLAHVNISENDIRKLRFIHISGTKGKGSTSAYCESILRHHGLTTGFFSSPHLIEVRERIKLNGRPISYEKFSKYFWTVYDALHAKRRKPDDMPAYFKFLTVMSFYVFVQEKPDVCVVEVGIGGLYDNTNIIPHTDVVGITSLGFDHTAMLGNTMDQIAAQKAGIMKPGCFAVTASGQQDVCKQVLREKAAELGCTLFEAPSMFSYDWKNQPYDEDWGSTVQSINISVAIQLAYLFLWRLKRQGEFKELVDKYMDILESGKEFPGECLRHPEKPYTKQQSSLKDFSKNCHRDPDSVYTKSSLSQGPLFKIDPETFRGLKACVWPGRVQLIKRANVKFFLDGAHTNESIELCSQWFKWKSSQEENRTAGKTAFANETIQYDRKTPLAQSEVNVQKVEIKPLKAVAANTEVVRVLVFNVTGDRDPGVLLPPLLKRNQFNYIVVTPNVVSNTPSPDNQYGGNRTVDRYGVNRVTIGSPLKETFEEARARIEEEDKRMKSLKQIVQIASELNKDKNTTVVQCDNVLDAYNFRKSLHPNNEVHYLVTGSLHLVGAFLNVLTNFDS